jgi:hypothetical protein
MLWFTFKLHDSSPRPPSSSVHVGARHHVDSWHASQYLGRCYHALFVDNPRCMQLCNATIYAN